MCPAKELYPEYIKNSYKLINKGKPSIRKNGKRQTDTSEKMTNTND